MVELGVALDAVDMLVMDVKLQLKEAMKESCAKEKGNEHKLF